MNDSSPEPFISLNALLLFLLPTLGMIIVLGNAITQIDVPAGWLLPFALLGLVAPIVYLALGENPSPTTDRRRFMWTMVICLTFVIGLTGRQIAIRPPAERPRGMYDGAVQSEVAAKMLLHGVNPYGANYQGTPYAAVNPPILGGPLDNVVWHHYIYPPLTFVLFIPIELLRPVLGPLADYRLVTVGALLLLTVLVIRQAWTFSQRTTAVLLTLGNPFLWAYAIIGANDILGPVALLGATILVLRRKWFWGGLIFGLALATKQTVWIISPLWVYWVWRQAIQVGQPKQALTRHVVGLGLALAAAFGPFFLWNPGRTFTDLVPFASGSFPYTYPIAGTTFLQYLHVLGLIPSAWSIIPTYLFQLLAGLPIMILILRWIHRSTEPSRWLVGAAILSVSVFLFSRYFNNNYLSFPAALLAAAYVWSVNQPPTGNNYGQV